MTSDIPLSYTSTSRPVIHTEIKINKLLFASYYSNDNNITKDIVQKALSQSKIKS